MISRIRLDAYGTTADEVERTLYPHADEIEKLLGVSVARGACVIERNLNEPEESVFAFQGRLVLHPELGLVTEGLPDGLPAEVATNAVGGLAGPNG